MLPVTSVLLGGCRKTELPGGLGRTPADDSLYYPIQSKMRQLLWWPTLILLFLQQRGRSPIPTVQHSPAKPGSVWEWEGPAARSPAPKMDCIQGAWYCLLLKSVEVKGFKVWSCGSQGNRTIWRYRFIYMYIYIRRHEFVSASTCAYSWPICVLAH